MTDELLQSDSASFEEGRDASEKLRVALALLISVGMVAAAFFATWNGTSPISSTQGVSDSAALIHWGTIGARLVETGVIDADAFVAAHRELPEAEVRAYLAPMNEPIVVNKRSARLVLNLLWAFGLANETDALSETLQDGGGPERVGRWASTGGWSLARGGAMSHFGAHALVSLNSEEERRLNTFASNIYRPCCNNPTSMPDCNHGMAMLGLLELLIADGKSDQEIWDSALAVNTLWFPDNYKIITAYANAQGKQATSRDLLGKSYSSASGFTNAKKVIQGDATRGSSCGV